MTSLCCRYDGVDYTDFIWTVTDCSLVYAYGFYNAPKTLFGLDRPQIKLCKVSVITFMLFWFTTLCFVRQRLSLFSPQSSLFCHFILHSCKCYPNNIKYFLKYYFFFHFIDFTIDIKTFGMSLFSCSWNSFTNLSTDFWNLSGPIVAAAVCNICFHSYCRAVGRSKNLVGQVGIQCLLKNPGKKGCGGGLFPRLP